ncbi:hypothetical protein ACOSP7_000885 [Xanthoceras sorbifolium]|uniref:BZIP domain-containing protein n=1 Tax=Xanthoceras sorbifolium TaxID=99658 RepID=A0ABQ8IMX4_9ROSI|nr:hypothetical protein JRO89_XS01G0328600 [Xanthoceras sorbifolium]
MGNNEDGKTAKPDKSSSPAPPDQGNVHVYPDWAAMQAYYGPRVAVPPYYNSAVGHAPHPYMWGPPQPMMPHYGAHYAAIYSHGGVYPAVPLGSHSHAQGVPSSPAAVTPLNAEVPTKLSGNSEQGLMKKLKGFDGLAMSIGNGNADNAEVRAEDRPSQSETEGSSDGSDGNTSGVEQAGRKRSREGTPTLGGDGKPKTRSSLVAAGEVNAASNKTVSANVAPGKSVEPVLPPGMTTALELRNPTSTNAKTSPISGPQPCSVLPPEVWLQNERELKRERRKQSNRESARRSRLRKQAETEELARKVDLLNAENVTLKSEVNQLTEKSEKLRLENATLVGKLKNAQLGHTQDIVMNNIDDKRVPPVSTENLLSRVNNSGSVDRNAGEEGNRFEKNSNNGAKLHQLLDTGPRTDAVAAG